MHNLLLLSECTACIPSFPQTWMTNFIPWITIYKMNMTCIKLNLRRRIYFRTQFIEKNLTAFNYSFLLPSDTSDSIWSSECLSILFASNISSVQFHLFFPIFFLEYFTFSLCWSTLSLFISKQAIKNLLCQLNKSQTFVDNLLFIYSLTHSSGTCSVASPIRNKTDVDAKISALSVRPSGSSTLLSTSVRTTFGNGVRNTSEGSSLDNLYLSGKEWNAMKIHRHSYRTDFINCGSWTSENAESFMQSSTRILRQWQQNINPSIGTF